jgi:hypothetical protein
MIHNERNTDGLLSQHMKNFVMYMSSTNEISNTSFETGTFVWHYERNKSSPKKLNKVLSSWNKSLGLKLKAFKAYRNELGHTRATLNVVLSQSGLNKLEKYSNSLPLQKVKSFLKKPKSFREFIKTLNKTDYDTQLKIQSEFFNTVNIRF